MPVECPLTPELSKWMEEAYIWLLNEFGKEHLSSKKSLRPVIEDFPLQYDGSKNSLYATAEIIAMQMDIDINTINIETYKDGIHEIESDLGFSLYTEVDKTEGHQFTAGMYFGKNEDGKFDVFIEEKNLKNPEAMVATLAHEFSHIKLLGENRIEENDEYLTDLTTVVFGLGIFNANNAFNFNKNFYSWSSTETGYFKQKEWGYALALFAHQRNETEPDWIKHLVSTLQKDVRNNLLYLNENAAKLFTDI